MPQWGRHGIDRPIVLDRGEAMAVDGFPTIPQRLNFCKRLPISAQPRSLIGDPNNSPFLLILILD